MKKANVCVIIPIYKSEPSAGELKSIRQTLKIMQSRDIYYVMPQGLDISRYPGEPVPVEIFPYYFQDLNNYSELCCQGWFYEKFLDYEFMLIAQPDCWTFRDELDKFCAMGYDYIGAPWPVMRGIPDEGVGNGGFCLRRVRKFVELCQLLRDTGGHPEDRFWCISMGPYLNIAPIDVAAHFSLEHNPSDYYNRFGKVMPMGCHKPWRFEYATFWKQRKVPAYIEG